MSAFVVAALTALAGQSAAQEPPRTVNEGILGTAEEFAVAGPARVCLIHTSVDLESGETAYLDYLGIHHGAFRVTGPQGTFRVREGDAWADPGGGRLVPDLRGRAVERQRQEGRLRYLIFGRPYWDPDDEDPLVWVDGDALGRSRDFEILARIDIDQRDPDSCTRQFVYGWDFILGDPQ